MDDFMAECDNIDGGCGIKYLAVHSYACEVMEFSRLPQKYWHHPNCKKVCKPIIAHRWPGPPPAAQCGLKKPLVETLNNAANHWAYRF